MDELYNYMITEVKRIFDLEAKKQGTKTLSSDINRVFGARVKIPGKEVEAAVVSADDSVIFHVGAGSHSFKDDIRGDCKTKTDFDEVIPQIEAFVKECFALKLVKKN